MEDSIIGPADRVLVTGANGFIGSRVVNSLLSRGLRNVRCLVRPTGSLVALQEVMRAHPEANVEVFHGNMLSRADCDRAAEGVTVVFNLVAGMEKSFPGCYLNSVVTLRNMLEAVIKHRVLRRFVHISSFAVYSNVNLGRRSPLDETCEIETKFMERADGYCYGKVKQDEMLVEYGREHRIPYVILRPGVPYGRGVKSPIHARVGTDTFGVFLHLGGGNRLPLTHIDNCGDAIALAGLRPGADGAILNIVDDDVPTSRQFLRLYKKHVHSFPSIYVPYWMFRLFCAAWERYSRRSGEQIPPAFNRLKCAALWKGNTYPNQRLKDVLGWTPAYSFAGSASEYFNYLHEMREKR